MNAALEQILSLQRMDRLLHELETEVRALPKRIAAAEKLAAEATRHREIAEANLEANRKEFQRLEYSTQDHQAKLAKLRKQIMDATTEEQLKAFQHEIEYAENGLRENEAAELLLLEANSELEAKLAAQRQAEQEAAAHLAQEKQAAEQRNTDVRKQGTKLYKERMALHASLAADHRSHYDQLRKSHKDGQVAVECTDGLCAGCLMTVRPALMQDIRAGTAAGNKLFQCENCHRWLVYNPATYVA
ncbi:MAG: hypothetical protein OHK0021_10660 [Bryobacter sp.]